MRRLFPRVSFPFHYSRLTVVICFLERVDGGVLRGATGRLGRNCARDSPVRTVRAQSLPPAVVVISARLA